MAERGFGDLRPVHLLVIEMLARSSRRATSLAETLGLTKQATGHLLDRMENLGYVERVRDPQDGRAKSLQLTGRGQRAAEWLRAVADETDEEWAAVLGRSRHRQLRATLGALITTAPNGDVRRSPPFLW